MGGAKVAGRGGRSAPPGAGGWRCSGPLGTVAAGEIAGLDHQQVDGHQRGVGQCRTREPRESRQRTGTSATLSPQRSARTGPRRRTRTARGSGGVFFLKSFGFSLRRLAMRCHLSFQSLGLFPR